MTMLRALSLVAILVSGLAATAAQDDPPLATLIQPSTASALIQVIVPTALAELVVDGEHIEGEGLSREVALPALDKGANRRHTFTVTWKPNTYTEMTRTKIVVLGDGALPAVDLSVDDPDDRVRVVYVPTPHDIAEAMVKLAGVKKGDVVYEPGCGDARITIAAINAGALRGICVDIDADRVKESIANVEAAGFADRIDVRLGDALDVKDLTEVTVVLLYMGDYFNMLIRPVLWRDLRTGSRIVSHRFTMGDWTPDVTESLFGDVGGWYDIHLWKITDADKR